MKTKVAFFDFGGCEGCQLQIANLEEDVLELIDIVKIVSFREIMKEHSDDYDIAVIEGSIMRPMDEERLKKIRKNAKILIALGACACLGGVQRMINQWPVEESKEIVYGNSEKIKDNPYFDNFHTKAVDEVVKVDAYVPGCPIDRNEFVRILIAIIQGKKPPLPDYPLCVECKKKENICLFEEGKLCLGPITRAGCNAICPSYGSECEGCRGFISHPEERAYKEVLEKYSISVEELLHKKSIFNYRYIEKKRDKNE